MKKIRKIRILDLCKLVQTVPSLNSALSQIFDFSPLHSVATPMLTSALE